MNKKRRVLIIVAICWTTHLYDGERASERCRRYIERGSCDRARRPSVVAWVTMRRRPAAQLP